jgi:L-fuculose-phosphate aldolase
MTTEQQHRKDMVEIGRMMYEKNLVVATDGNISIRMAEDRLLATPSGVSKGHMQPEDLIVTDMTGKKLSGERNPSSEIRLHLAIYQKRADVKSVVHGHPPVATAFTIAGLSLAQCVIPEVVFTLGSIPTTEYATPTSEEGPRVIQELIEHHDAIILDRHGAVTAGKDVFDAYRKLEKVEHCAEVTLAARQLGQVKTLTPDEIRRLMDVREQLSLGGKATLACSNCGACGKPYEPQEGSAAAGSEPNTDEDKIVELVLREVQKALGKS